MTRKQHYVPCCYLKRFSLDPSNGRKSKVWMFNGVISKEVTVETQGYDDYTYSKENADDAERFFRDNFENDYTPLADEFVNCRELGRKRRIDVFIFVLTMYFRSPIIQNKTSSERYDAIEGIAGSLLNHIEPLTENDWIQKSNHLDRVINKFKLVKIRFPIRMWTSDKPTVIFEDLDGTLATVFFMMVDPDNMALFYRKDKYRYNGQAPSAEDIRHVFLLIRDGRLRNLYYPVDLSLFARGSNLPIGDFEDSYVTEDKVGHSFFKFQQGFTFLTRKG